MEEINMTKITERDGKEKDWDRRNFLKVAGGALGGLVVAGKAVTGLAAVSYEENPLVGCVDFHVHSGPDVVRRALNDIELVQKAKAAGMRGLNLYNHQTMTLDRAYIARQMVPGIEVFGGIALNYPIGGINPEAVSTALKFSGDCMRYVKMPSQSAAHDLAEKAHLAGKKFDGKGLRIYDSAGKILPDVTKILKMIAKADIAMLTGHISPEEDVAIVKAAKEEGVRKMVVTHAMNATQKVPMDMMKQMAEMGAFIEHIALTYLRKDATIEQFAKAIKEVGAEHTIISSDLGQGNNPVPTEGLTEFILLLMKNGVTKAEIDVMTKKNPARLLGMEAF
jgi:hypothetical protein